MTAESIKELLRTGETLTLECKKAQGGLPDSIWETYSSFANTAGGVILLGVAEMRHRTSPSNFQIVGVSNPDKLLKDFWN